MLGCDFRTHISASTFSGRFNRCFDTISRKEMKCTCGRPSDWNFPTSTYEATLSRASHFGYTTSIRKQIYYDYQIWKMGLSCGTCPGKSNLLISGQLGLHAIVKKSKCPFFIGSGSNILLFLSHTSCSTSMCPWKHENSTYLHHVHLVFHPITKQPQKYPPVRCSQLGLIFSEIS